MDIAGCELALQLAAQDTGADVAAQQGCMEKDNEQRKVLQARIEPCSFAQLFVRRRVASSLQERRVLFGVHIYSSSFCRGDGV